MPISASDIKNIALKEDDFGHEIRVGSIIAAVPGIHMEHGGTYTDPISNKPRQFDYRCWLTNGIQRVILAVECKSLNQSAALAVCGTKRRANEAFHEFIHSRQGTFVEPRQVVSGLSSITFKVEEKHSIYPPGEFVGKSLMRLKNDKNGPVSVPDSDIYDKWSQALSSAVELAESACESARPGQVPNFYCIILPMVIVPDGLLWQVDYDSAGNLPNMPMLVDTCELFVGREIKVVNHPGYHQWYNFSHIHFFTRSGFSNFLTKLVAGGDIWNQLFHQKAVRL